MNDSNEPNPPPLPGGTPAAVEAAATIPSLPANPSLMQVLESILRSPGQLIDHFVHREGTGVVVKLIFATIVCLAAFGFFVGTFSMGEQLWAAPLKIVAGLFFAMLLCFPSLYIFSNLSGLEVSFRAVGGMLLCAVCLMSLLLLGFAPIIWLFSQSTTHLSFVGPLNLLVWLIALWFGVGLIRQSARMLGAQNVGYLRVWITLFLLVLMQMSTSLRPIIGTADTQFTTEKVFFLQHWYNSLEEDSQLPGDETQSGLDFSLR